MNAREAFALRAVEHGANIAALCREYSVSRKTGYTWMDRYVERGLLGTCAAFWLNAQTATDLFDAAAHANY